MYARPFSHSACLLFFSCIPQWVLLLLFPLKLLQLRLLMRSNGPRWGALPVGANVPLSELLLISLSLEDEETGLLIIQKGRQELPSINDSEEAVVVSVGPVMHLAWTTIKING